MVSRVLPIIPSKRSTIFSPGAGKRSPSPAPGQHLKPRSSADAYPEPALTHLVEAKRFAETTQIKWVQAEALRLQGDLLILTGGHTAAEASFRDAIALAQRQGARLFELRASTSLARLWREQGKR